MQEARNRVRIPQPTRPRTPPCINKTATESHNSKCGQEDRVRQMQGRYYPDKELARRADEGYATSAEFRMDGAVA
jgi:hypothetical protein